MTHNNDPDPAARAPVLVHYQGNSHDCASGETVLECLERHGHKLPSLCRSGSCRVCQQQCAAGVLPPAATFGLRDTTIADGGFLPCVCEPTADIDMVDSSQMMRARVIDKSSIGQNVVRLRVEDTDRAGVRGDASHDAAAQYIYRPGQHAMVVREDGLARPYSLASVTQDAFLEFHVEVVAGGEMSSWIANELTPGDEVQVGRAQGEAFYLPRDTDMPLLLLGTGTALAPLYAIARAALQQRHNAPILLLHGATDHTHLYYEHELHSLAARHGLLSYIPVVEHGVAPDGGVSGKLENAWQEHVADLTDWQVHVAGSPQTVKSARRATFLAGASMKNLYATVYTPTTSCVERVHATSD